MCLLVRAKRKTKKQRNEKNKQKIHRHCSRSHPQREMSKGSFIRMFVVGNCGALCTDPSEIRENGFLSLPGLFVLFHKSKLPENHERNLRYENFWVFLSSCGS